MKKLILFILMSVSIHAKAQTNTWDAVYAVFQSNCVSCHGGSAPSGLLDLSAASATVYTSIINKTPVNPAAAAKGNRIIAPGDIHRSFLFRKCQNGLDKDCLLELEEGNEMPKQGSKLSKKDVETIRQWILYGAKQTGVAVDTALIGTYYRGKGIDRTTTLAPPPPGKGFQVHYGPVFVKPHGEVENYLKYNTLLPDSIEVTQLDLVLDKHASHHFLAYKFLNGEESSFADGLRAVTNKSNAEVVNAWQTPYNVKLPVGTAFRWHKNAVLDLNMHCFNHSDSVILSDVRFNVYTQANGIASAVMHTMMAHNYVFSIPNNNTDVKLTKNFTDSNIPSMYVWTLSSHTHKYGIDFDIFKRKAGGGKDIQLYEGFYDFEYKFNQGYYSWHEPPIKRFDPFYYINPKDGFVVEATYRNNGPKAVGFGLTTEDEMMLMFVQYTTKLVTGMEESAAESTRLQVFPNPSDDIMNVAFLLTEYAQVKLELFNLLGERITTIIDQEKAAGYQTIQVNAKSFGWAPGIYYLKLQTGKTFTSAKVVVKD